MPPGYVFTLLNLLCVIGGLTAKSYNEGQPYHENHETPWDSDWSDEYEPLSDTIDIDNDQGVSPRNQQWSGSGWANEDDDEDKENWFASGAGQPKNSRPMTKCEELRGSLNTEMLIGAYIPRCTNKGEFEPMQCHSSTGECWCVDHDGREIPITMRKSPDMPNCDQLDRRPTPKPRVPGVGSENNDKDMPDKPYKPTDSNDGIIYDPPSNEKPKGATDQNIEFKNMEDDEIGGGSIVQENKVSSLGATIMGKPGILAGIIGGAVVGLLCAVLLVMFIVYRMRKKDEGSYALEEPKMTSPSRGYHRAPTKEYWA